MTSQTPLTCMWMSLLTSSHLLSSLHESTNPSHPTPTTDGFHSPSCSPKLPTTGPLHVLFPPPGMHSCPLSLVMLFHLSDLQTSFLWLLSLDYRLSWFKTLPLLSFHQSYHLTSLHVICIHLASLDILSVWNNACSINTYWLTYWLIYICLIPGLCASWRREPCVFILLLYPQHLVNCLTQNWYLLSKIHKPEHRFLKLFFLFYIKV